MSELPATRMLASGRIGNRGVELRGWHEDDLRPFLESQAAQIAALTAERAALKDWRNAIDEALVVAHLGVATEPYDDLNRLLQWHHDIWLDPTVSSDAQALIDRGAESARREADALRCKAGDHEFDA